jgi:hypothetical protein
MDTECTFLDYCDFRSSGRRDQSHGLCQRSPTYSLPLAMVFRLNIDWSLTRSQRRGYRRF